MEMIVADGHEIGAHGYLHENPIAMTPSREEDVLVKSIELIKGLTGAAPRGYVRRGGKCRPIPQPCC